jgi:S1-C subfamily serine protease
MSVSADARSNRLQGGIAAITCLVLVATGCGNGPSSPPGPSTAPASSSLAAVSALPGSSAAAPGGSQSIGAALQAEFVAIVQKVGPSVVLIETPEGLGSGVVYDAKGDIVTNAHVVGDFKQFLVATADGRQMKAALVGSFPIDDVAVIRAEKADLPPATFGDSSKLIVGDVVLAIGNPLGLQSSVTEGIVSATGRTVTEPGGAALPNTIQTSAAINPGNSGGALVDLNGAVIGMPTLAATDPGLGAAPGIGFAIPSNMATDIAKQFVDNGKVVSTHRAYLGVRTANVQGASGVVVYSVDPGGPAATAGVKPGELITEVDGKPTPNSAVLGAVLAELTPGQTSKVKITRPDGSTADISVTLGELPAG